MNLSRQLVASVAGLTLAGAALAQSAERPWYIGAVLEAARESNVLGTRPGTEIADTIYTATLRGGLNQPFGRQRVYADASLSQQRFNTVSGRDNDGYNLGAGFDWSTVERLSGSFTLNANQQLTDFVVGGVIPSTISNIENSEEFDARIRLGAVTAVSFDASLGTRRVSFSDPNFASQEYKQNRGSLGVIYQPSGILTLGTGIRIEQTQYQAAAAGQTSPDDNDRQDVYFTANWVPTGASTVYARINVGKTQYTLGTAADFDGVTGQLTWDWRPTGLLKVTTGLSHDTGQDSGFLRLTEGSPVTASDFSQITDNIFVQAGYELTAKISLTAGLSYSRRDLVDGFTGATGNDKTTTFTLGARWAATRTISFGCDARLESRSASGIGSTTYENDRVSCVGQVTFD